MPKKIDKFYNFSFDGVKNETDLWLYGEIISGGNDWKWSEDDVTFQDFKDTIDNMGDSTTLNIHVNSPGGSVFCSNAIVSLLKSTKNKGITVNSYIDSLGASCASWLPLVADNVYIYKGSILMLHKPMTSCWSANANDMKEQIDLLDKIENDVMLPLYMAKVNDGITEDYIKELLDKETWLTSKEIQNVFQVTLLDEEKQITACVDRDAMKNYINIPDNIKDLLNKKEEEDLEDNKEKVVDNEEIVVNEEEESTEKEEETPLEQEEEVVEGEEKEDESSEGEESEESKEEETENSTDEDAQAKLDESNEKVLALNDKVQELTALVNSLQPIVDEYNAKKEAELKAENEAKIEATTNLYKNKFEKIGALDKFNEKEVQDLIANSIEDASNLSKLNSMLVELINVDEPSKIVKIGTSETGTEVKDLIPTENDGLSSLFE